MVTVSFSVGVGGTSVCGLCLIGAEKTGFNGYIGRDIWSIVLQLET